MNLNKDYYSISEVSELTNLKKPKIIRKIRSGEIKAKKIGWMWTIPSLEVERLMKENSKKQKVEEKI